jgi:hypothetical protein
MTVRKMNCLGLSSLAECVYNPKAPATAYFTIGDGVADLSLLLLIPQFVKPLYEFRLSMRRMKRSWLYAVATASFVAILIAALVPQMPFAGVTLVGWPVFWELFAGLGFLSCYSVLAYSYLFPAKVKEGSAELFARGAARFLAHASTADHVDFAGEVRKNMKPLLRLAQSVDFKEANKNAFYSFTNRKKIRDADYAETLLAILADPAFCRSLTERCPWDVAEILHSLSEKEDPVSLRSGRALVQQLARQALISNESIITRETDHVGFGRVPVLSDALFGNWHINREILPFQGLRYDDFDVSEAYVDRLNFAAEISIKNLFNSRGAWEATNIYNLVGHYEGIFLKARMNKAESQAWRLCGAIGSGVKELIEQTRLYLASLPLDKRQAFYKIDDGNAWRDSQVVDAIAKLTIDYWNSIANDFQGFGDPNWTSALDTWDACFDRYGVQPSGMDPLQQRVALLMRKKIDDNMMGWYPALTRLCLSMLGPYEVKDGSNPDAACGLVRRDFYSRLKKLPQLAKDKPEKFKDYLPPNVSLDVDTETLTYTYSYGTAATTVLSGLTIAPVSLEMAAVNIPPAPEPAAPTAANEGGAGSVSA